MEKKNTVKKASVKKAPVKKAPVKKVVKKAPAEEVPVAIEPDPGKPAPVGAKKKICIVGFAPGREIAPYDDDSFEFWGVNEMHFDTAVRKIDVLFELHDYKWLCEGKRQEGHIDWLRTATIPIMMQEFFTDIPMSIPFPRKPIEEKYGSYFTNTISWEIALAMDLGAEEIHIYGVNMATEIEYQSQRPSCEYYIGLAMGKGIKVYIPPESDLLKSFYAYGFEDGELSYMSQRLKRATEEQAAKKVHFDGQLNACLIERSRAEGAEGAFAQVNKAFVYPHSTWEHEQEKKK